MKYPPEPADKDAFTAATARFYSRIARVYGLAVRLFPVWRRWIGQVLPYVQGPRVLEVSFGTGYLLGQYGPNVDVYGVEYNAAMIGVARRQMEGSRRPVYLQQADVANLPFQSGAFDTIVNTMAFTAYPDGARAIAELGRVVRPGGRLLMVDLNYPPDGNPLGLLLVKLGVTFGDILRDMGPLFKESGFVYVDETIGGWGSLHLYLATRVA